MKYKIYTKDTLELIPFGYAPGGYQNRCHVCNEVHNGVDKRASTCFECASELANQAGYKNQLDLF